MTKRICVTGASGRAWRVAVRELLAHGYRVLATGRVMPAEDLGARPLLADLTDYGQATEVLQGVDAVLHRPTSRPRRSIPRDHVQPEHDHELQRVHRCGPGRAGAVVWASSETTLGLPFDVPPR